MATRSSLMKKTDAELLDAWAAGDKTACDVLLDRHFSALHRFFINKVHEDAVSDLAQDTMLECARSVANFRGDSTFRTFLLGIAHHQLLHHYRRKRRKEGRLDLEIDPLVDTASAVVEARGMSSLLARRREQALILAALRKVAIDYQVILELFFWEDLTAKECADVLSLGLGAVKSRLRRAKQALAEALDKAEAPPAEKASVSRALGEWMMGIHDFIRAGSPRAAEKLREWDAVDQAELEAAQA